ncbi:hypothetical protein ATE47_18800 (plasmid) [Chryseobacterium sp. IHB B 17019]|jgi:hypothetical protein|uniref:hypothetical protein n=1 Tax=Chryseobacterium sp. IHB B 17019 TaxID=1721091 RepID=UPI00071F0BBF|nr:hypothetical protein [Chryseobacterium sp. IHB B 17019]ALR29321.1 hypothetical protein ATE47_01680 [Chryseobacterium sp. IHB B 17019]ALR32667.1 hypothetical protein ATE47_18800 [Chryseobacterium sp. IHB B 17019]
MQKYTKYLFFISLFLSLLSLYIIGKGGKEIYPFYSWKLFTSPSGSEKFEEQYRLYRVEGNDTIRVLYQATEIYDENNLALITGFYGKKIEKNENREESIKKMKIFMKSYRPEYNNLLLYKESFNPWDLGKASFKINKILITKL